MTWRNVFFVLVLALQSDFSQATPSDVKPLDFTIHQEYTSTRALGMGNAFTAVADDHSAIFYNPAALAFREDGHLRMFVRAGTDANSVKMMHDMSDLDKLPEAEQEQASADLLAKHYGEHFYFRVPTVGAIWARPRWGIAFIPADFSLDMSVHQQVGPTLNMLGYVDSTLAYSYAHKLAWLPKTHELAWGATVKGVHRIFMGKVIMSPDLVENSKVLDKEDAKEGLTGDLDFGTMWKPPVPQQGFFKFLKYMQPTFAVVGRNLIDYGFSTNLHLVNKTDFGDPPHLVRRFDFGSKWQLPQFWKFDPHVSADIRDVGHENWSLRKGSHVGVELSWKMFNWWKGHYAAGFNQGYWTLGFGARLAWFQLDVATFGEEVGSPSTPQESRRYMLELALDF